MVTTSLWVEEAQAKIIKEWHYKWLAQVFVNMVPQTKWKSVHSNVAMRDIGHIHYESKYGPKTWRTARVSSVKTDNNGLVRTVVIEL